jgi:hypothetical protein
MESQMIKRSRFSLAIDTTYPGQWSAGGGAARD